MAEKSSENRSKNDEEYNDPTVRRNVRAEYRNLAMDLNENAEEMTNPECNKLTEYLEMAESLFSKVRHPREAVHDSSVLVTLAAKGREQAQQLKTDLVSFDNHTFMEKLITYVGGRNISGKKSADDGICDLSNAHWKQLGNRCRPLFRETPTFNFLLGPLVLEVAVKPKIERHANRARLPQGEATQLKSIEGVEKQEEATTKEVERVYKILKRSTQAGKCAMCLFKFVINPTSFGQSVENLFHLSFLIKTFLDIFDPKETGYFAKIYWDEPRNFKKDGRASIELDENELPLVNLHKEYNENEHDEVINKKQVVLPFSMTQWKDLIETFEINEPTIPTRTAMVLH